MSVRPYRDIQRRKSRKIMVGTVPVGGDSPITVQSMTNTPLLTRVLRPGDSYRVPNQAGLTMMTGNAGVLDVFVDGTAAPPLGAVGAVRRNIALDAERLRTGAAGTQ